MFRVIKRKFNTFLQSPETLLIYMLTIAGPCITDRLFLKILYRIKTKQKLNLDNPQTFNEKLQWLKLYNRKPEYTKMVDKVLVKDFVASKIGAEYIIPTLGVWEKATDIDYDNLPDKFVLKTNHSGGNSGVVICKDKNNLDKTAVTKKLDYSLKHHNIYKSLREWPYKNVRKRILAEQLLVDEKNPDNEIHDYKFYCFDGRVCYVLVSNGRGKGPTKFDYFDKAFNHLPFKQGGENYDGVIAKPQNLDLMISLAETLSRGIPHVRVDFYDVNNHVYFGEMTFFDSSGLAKFEPAAWDEIWGKEIHLKNIEP